MSFKQQCLVRFVCISFLIILGLEVVGQEDSRNKGLSHAQPEKALPKSRDGLSSSQRVSKVDPIPELRHRNCNEYLITGGWEMAAAKQLNVEGEQISQAMTTSSWYNATVPGTVLTTLVDQGVYPDPYFGLNNLSIPEDLCRQNWWYRTSFQCPAGIAYEQVLLKFNGINYEANVWLNGHSVGHIKGAFIRGEFDVTNYLQAENYLAVQIIPPPNPGIPHEASAIDPKGPNGGALCQDGPTFIASEGWDWMPGIRDRNIGIWQDVCLKFYNSAYFKNPQFHTDLPLPDTSKAYLSLKTDIISEEHREYCLRVNVNGQQLLKKQLKLERGSNTITLSSEDIPELVIDNPKLWWPNGYGEQSLYYGELVLEDSDGNILDQQQTRFGIREMEYEFAVATGPNRSKQIIFNPITLFKKYDTVLFDNLNRETSAQGVQLPTLREGVNSNDFPVAKGSSNPYLVVKVNGQPIFCKGGNWGMDDAMKRVSRERMEPYFRLHKDANYTMIRNWTGESTEEVFYELADEYGLLVWNDFWLSTEGYNMLPNDKDLFVDNARDVVKRFFNHPSIAIWCARNEGFAPESLETRLANLIVQEDGTRLYLSNSRDLNLRPSGPWDYKNPSEYFNHLADGFTTEVGTISFATEETTRSMMSPKDVWPISDTWYYHDLHTRQEYFRAATIRDFGEAFSAEDFLERCQITNYNSHRAIYEAWNNKLWEDASGVLLWMTHPAWPSMIWQTYTYDYETHGAYFGAKKACEPVHVQMNDHDKRVVAINTTLNTYPDISINAVTMNVYGNIIHQSDTIITLPANQKVDCFFFGQKNEDFKVPFYFTKLALKTSTGELLSENLYMHSTRWDQQYEQINLLDNVYLEVEKNLEVKEGKVVGSVTLKNNGDTVAFSVKLNARFQDTKERVLPAYFSDGYFSIFPNEQKVVEVEFPLETGKSLQNYSIALDGYNVEKQSF